MGIVFIPSAVQQGVQTGFWPGAENNGTIIGYMMEINQKKIILEMYEIQMVN